MKKVKISLTAVAFVLAAGAAVAQSYQDLPESDPNPKTRFDCATQIQPSCGSVHSVIYYGGTDTPVPSADLAYDLQYQP